jgi:hypothetical protein
MTITSVRLLEREWGSVAELSDYSRQARDDVLARVMSEYEHLASCDNDEQEEALDRLWARVEGADDFARLWLCFAIVVRETVRRLFPEIDPGNTFSSFDLTDLSGNGIEEGHPLRRSSQLMVCFWNGDTEMVGTLMEDSVASGPEYCKDVLEYTAMMLHGVTHGIERTE